MLIKLLAYTISMPYIIYRVVRDKIKQSKCEHRYYDGNITMPGHNKYGEMLIIEEEFKTCRRCGHKVVTSPYRTRV